MFDCVSVVQTAYVMSCLDGLIVREGGWGGGLFGGWVGVIS